ncbi:MAG: hypothetical protein ACXVA4_14445 [Ktedonobacterales bacterium]
MSEISHTTEPDVSGMAPVPQREQRQRTMAYVERHFRTPELASLLAWIRQGPGTTIIWGGQRWERSLTPRQHLAMATCEALALKVLQQNPRARSEWARLAREGHDVWQVLVNNHYLGVIVDGVYRSYKEIERGGNEGIMRH